MATIFLSYSQQDVDIARKIYDTLTQKGMNVWFAEQKLRTGESLQKQIQEALENSQVLLLLLSPASMQSSSVAQEYQYFIRQNKLLIPTLIAGSPQDIPYRLKTYQFIDIRQPNDEKLGHLISRVQELLERGNIVESTGKKQVTITFDIDGDTDLENIVSQITKLKGAHDVRINESEA